MGRHPVYERGLTRCCSMAGAPDQRTTGRAGGPAGDPGFRRTDPRQGRADRVGDVDFRLFDDIGGKRLEAEG